jgi:hypothetical protein
VHFGLTWCAPVLGVWALAAVTLRPHAGGRRSALARLYAHVALGAIAVAGTTVVAVSTSLRFAVFWMVPVFGLWGATAVDEAVDRAASAVPVALNVATGALYLTPTFSIYIDYDMTEGLGHFATLMLFGLLSGAVGVRGFVATLLLQWRAESL